MPCRWLTALVSVRLCREQFLDDTKRGKVMGVLALMSRCDVDHGSCELGKLLVGIGLFGKRRLEQLHPFLVSEQLSVGSGTPVTSHFVMFDALGGGNQAGI